jgi:hypothetical protein
VITLGPVPRPELVDKQGVVLSPWQLWFSKLWSVLNQVNTGKFTVALLPSAVLSGLGARAFATDSTGTTFASTLTGGGNNVVPVYSDGSVWRIG